MSLSGNKLFYTNSNYYDVSNALINYNNLTGNSESLEHPLSKYARELFFSPNYNKELFDSINWANNLGKYKNQNNLINPLVNNVLMNIAILGPIIKHISINIHYENANKVIGSAGALLAENWNNTLSGALIDSTGTDSGATMALSSNADPIVYRAPITSADPEDGAHGSLFHGYLDNFGGQSVTISNIPLEFQRQGYELRIYHNNDTDTNRLRWDMWLGGAGNMGFQVDDGIVNKTYYSYQYTQYNNYPIISALNPPETDRTYSSLWPGTYPGGNNTTSKLGSPNGWIAYPPHNAGEWMRINAGSVISVQGIRVEPRSTHYLQCVKSVTVQHSVDDSTWTNVIFVGGGTTFTDATGNFDALFESPVMAQYIRITVQAWVGHIVMRAGLLIGGDPFGGGTGYIGSQDESRTNATPSNYTLFDGLSGSTLTIVGVNGGGYDWTDRFGSGGDTRSRPNGFQITTRRGDT